MLRRIITGALVALLTLPFAALAEESSSRPIGPHRLVVKGAVRYGTPTLDVGIRAIRSAKATATVSVFVNGVWQEDIEILAPTTQRGPMSLFETTIDLAALDLKPGDVIHLEGTVTDGRTTLTASATVRVKGRKGRDIIIVPAPTETIPTVG